MKLSEIMVFFTMSVNDQKQPFVGVSQKRCIAKTQQIYRRSPMQKCDFNKVA